MLDASQIKCRLFGVNFLINICTKVSYDYVTQELVVLENMLQSVYYHRYTPPSCFNKWLCIGSDNAYECNFKQNNEIITGEEINNSHVFSTQDKLQVICKKEERKQQFKTSNLFI